MGSQNNGDDAHWRTGADWHFYWPHYWMVDSGLVDAMANGRRRGMVGGLGDDVDDDSSNYGLDDVGQRRLQRRLGDDAPRHVDDVVLEQVGRRRRLERKQELVGLEQPQHYDFDARILSAARAAFAAATGREPRHAGAAEATG